MITYLLTIYENEKLYEGKSEEDLAQLMGEYDTFNETIKKSGNYARILRALIRSSPVEPFGFSLTPFVIAAGGVLLALGEAAGWSTEAWYSDGSSPLRRQRYSPSVEAGSA